MEGSGERNFTITNFFRMYQQKLRSRTDLSRSSAGCDFFRAEVQGIFCRGAEVQGAADVIFCRGAGRGGRAAEGAGLLKDISVLP